jgi:hypothetical protein
VESEGNQPLHKKKGQQSTRSKSAVKVVLGADSEHLRKNINDDENENEMITGAKAMQVDPHWFAHRSNTPALFYHFLSLQPRQLIGSSKARRGSSVETARKRPENVSERSKAGFARHMRDSLNLGHQPAHAHFTTPYKTARASTAIKG